MARAARVTSDVKNSAQDVAANLYAAVLDDVEQEFDLAASESSKDRLSYGLLTMDLISNGGLVSGMVTASGPEQSGKSTLTLTAMHSGIKAKIPVIAHFDAEGTAQQDADYAAAILRVKSLLQVYGQKINGVWRIPPRVRYWDTTVMEKYFNSVVQMLNRLPDKVYLQERERWFLRVPRGTDKMSKRQASFLKLGDPDGKLSNKQFAWIPAPNSSPQALIIPDSYVTFLPEDVDENEEMSGALAEQAREFAKHLKRIVGKFRRKQAVVFGVNQWRERPGMVMGPKNYEPGGNALKLYSSVRFVLNPRAVPNAWRHEGKFSQYSLEPSVEGRGDDAYAYKHVKNVKNKAGPPWRECWTRVWIKDHRGLGRGFDPVYDTAQFLIMTGLAREERKHAMQFAKSDILPPALAKGRQLSWADFKTLIIAEEYPSDAMAKAANKVLQGGERLHLRAACRRLIRSGKAMELLNANVSDGTSRSKVRDLEAV